MNQPENRNIENIVLRLMEDEKITSYEASLLKQWITDNPEKSDELYSLSALWSKLDTYREVNDEVIRNRWEMTRDRIRSSSKKGLKYVLKTYQKYAAIFILGALLPSLVLVYRAMFENNQMLSEVISVPYGAKSTVTLPDGTEIILNAGSKLKYDAKYGNKDRTVTLKGEAYFKVAKNKRKPFLVNTKHLVVKAYGTEFNVKCYDSDNTIETTLVEGSIGIKLKNANRKKEYLLKPNEQLIYSYTDQENARHPSLIRAKNVNIQLYTSWIYDKIQVKSVTLKELAVKLQRKYNVTIHIENKSLEKMKFTGILENETIEQILQALELSASINYKIDDREIWLYRDQN